MTKLTKMPELDPPTPWVQTDRGGQMAMAKLIGANQRAAQVAAVLMALTNFGNSVYISHGEIGALLNCHPRTVGRAMKYLVQNKWVLVSKAQFGGMNLYTMNSHLVWQGKREFLKMSKLKDPLMVAGREQPGFVRLPQSEWARPRREVEKESGQAHDWRQEPGPRSMVEYGPDDEIPF